MLADRARVHREDVTAAEDAAAAGQAADAKLPGHDAALVALVNEIAGLGRAVARGVADVDRLRVEQGATAAAPASRQAAKTRERIGELLAELDDLKRERQELGGGVGDDWGGGAARRRASHTRR